MSVREKSSKEAKHALFYQVRSVHYCDEDICFFFFCEAKVLKSFNDVLVHLEEISEIQNDGQIDKGVMPNVADRLEGIASQSTENQGCNPTIPRSESSSRDTQRVNALEGNISDELSLVVLPNSAPYEAQEISSPLEPLLEKTISLVSPKAPSGPSQTKQPKGKVNLKRIA
nr:hypothetical protein CFP56_60070 [Quercus suber]